jgi:hypothetical protein
METNSTQQEILLIWGTTLTSGFCCKKEDFGGEGSFSEKEELEEACWNGLLPRILPEICKQPANGAILYLWDVREASSFLELELADFPAIIDRHFSIVPYSFLEVQEYN